MLDLVVVDHSFAWDTYRTRWRLLAEQHPVNVTLLVPKLWYSSWIGDTVKRRQEHVRDGRYEVIPLPTTSKRNWSRYLFASPDAKLRSIDPDLIHIQHSEGTWLNHQLITYRNLWARQADITFFTMNALGVPREKWHQRMRWRHLRRNATAAICHYPGCRDSLREANFENPIYLQTSYGVDETIFYPDDDVRKRVRNELNLEDRFVVGYAGRLTSDKGVDDLLDAFPIEGVNWALLLIGDGEMREVIEQTVERNGWEDRVKMPGYVPVEEVARYMQALDCYVLGSKEREDWIDTFPRSIIQAMACEVPVIGSDSGAIPFQVEDAGMIVQEGGVQELHNKIRQLATNNSLRNNLGERGRKKSIGRFGQKKLADNFYKIMKQIVSGEIVYSEGNEHNQFEAY